MWQSVMGFVRRNERYLSGAFFLGGFVVDLVTLQFLSLSQATLVLGIYVIAAAAAILVAHALIGERENPGRLVSFGAVAFPLVAQFFIGGALSGLVILFTMGASLAASWPFLMLLAAAFISTEMFSKYRTRVTFQTVLLFFTAYAYAIFTLPLIVRHIGSVVFIGSGLLAVAALIFFLRLMRFVGGERVQGKIRPIMAWSIGIAIALHGAYFAGVIPPLPLTLAAKGAYYHVARQGADYALRGEQPSRLPFTRPVIYRMPGEEVYAFSAVFAPTKFSTHIIHRWEYFDTEKDAWVVQRRIELPVAGGRDGGYRTYSTVSPSAAGKWRVVVTTKSGQVIGHIPFTVIRGAAQKPVTRIY